MAGHQQGSVKGVGQPFLQPDDRLHIQVVGGLVQQQHIRLQGQDFGQGDPHLPAAGERLHRMIEAIRPDPQAGQYGLGTGVQVIAAAVFELLLDYAVALQKCCHLIIRLGLTHGGLHLLQLTSQTHGLG
ncbi:hypothetical protein SDC9_204971 [bioreactor metagenome]|uniref:Uncharacterized protein n=1 Tax=bioreactor metagenome TaxID=1076179 RepID=A0A645J1J8_9ZZZZ